MHPQIYQNTSEIYMHTKKAHKYTCVRTYTHISVTVKNISAVTSMPTIHLQL